MCKQPLRPNGDRSAAGRQNRPLDGVYPTLYTGAAYYCVRGSGVIPKLAAYAILGIHTKGHKGVLAIRTGDNGSPKYWLPVWNEWKNRVVKDVLVICADGLAGIKGAVAGSSPKQDTSAASSIRPGIP